MVAVHVTWLRGYVQPKSLLLHFAGRVFFSNCDGTKRAHVCVRCPTDVRLNT
jgi:hypothetical protein